MTERPDFYKEVDGFKVMCLDRALDTSHNMDRLGIREVSASRGESAQVIDFGDYYVATVNEELGTKNLAADEMQEFTGESHYYPIGLDVAASEFNDLITVGADPISTQAHFIVGSKEWFGDKGRGLDLVRGFKRGCDLAGANWLGGETGILEGIVEPERIALSGSALGVIMRKEKLVLGDKLGHGDLIIYLPSSGIHANGATFARTVAESLPQSYQTIIGSGETYGEALLAPTPIYADAVRRLQNAEVDIHYMANITGHGWRKLMRADRDLTYVLSFLPENRPPIFDFIQRHSGISDSEMYDTFNMGMGYAIYIGRDDLGKALQALQSGGWPARLAGHIEEGPQRVIIKPTNLVFEADSLNIRA